MTVIFDGAGTTWVPELADPEREYHRVLEDVREAVGGACLYRSRAYGAKDGVEEAGIPFLDDFRDHPSVRALVAEGCRVMTF